MDWKDIIISNLKNNQEFDLEKAAKVAPEDISQILRNLPKHIEEILKNNSNYHEVLYLLCLHILALRGDLYLEFPLQEQKMVLERAADASVKASSIAKSLEEEELEAFYMGVAGNFYHKLNMFLQAERAYSEALEIYRRFEENEQFRLSAAAISTCLGDLYNSAGKFSQAEKKYNDALEILHEVERTPACNSYMSKTYNGLGDFYKNAGKFSEAEKAYKEALKIKQKLKKSDSKTYAPEVAKTLDKLGLLYFDIGEFDKAQEEHTKALNTYREREKNNPDAHMVHVARVLNNIGNAYAKMKKSGKAEKCYREALEMYEQLEEQNPRVYTYQLGTTLNNLGALCRDQAEHSYMEAISKFREAALWFDAARTFYNLSNIESREKNLEASRKLLELAILFSREKEYIYAQKGDKEAIYFSLLNQNISSFGVLETLRDPRRLSLLWDSIFQEGELEKAHNNVHFQKQLVEKALNNDVTALEPGVFAEILPKDLLFIYIQVVNRSVYFFPLDAGKLSRFECGIEFFNKGMKLYKMLRYQEKESAPQVFEKHTREWYRMLPQSIKYLIRKKKYIVLSPDLFCSFLPLEALQRRNNPLCIEKTVVRATSVYQFATLLKRNPQFTSALVVGNPWPKCDERVLEYSLPSSSEKDYPISYLTGAENEAKDLVEFLPDPTCLLGNEATGEKFLSEISRHSLIHFSGHGSLGRILFLSGPFQGFPPPFEPGEFSRLRKAERTAKTKKINMMQEWHPITDIDLANIPLIEGTVAFLNACETGQQECERGGYYHGLSAVFLENGAHSVISSLVPIFDEPSGKFAVCFYKNLLKSNSVSKSLKKTRIYFKNKYEDQICWIPFLHYGSPF